jgi:membrane protein
VKKEPANNSQDLIGKISDFVTVDIWRIRLEDLPFGKSFLIRQLRVIILAIRGFDKDKCIYRASSLTFYTLLSIVPVVAMLFGIAKGFGFEKMLRQDLLKRFSGQEEILTQVIDFAQNLLDTTRGGLIAGIGLIVLFWSVIKVLSHIEVSLNEIWQIKEHRTWARKFSDYLAIMLISPLFMLISSSATVYITTQITQITQQVKLLGMISPLIFLGLKLIPYVSIWILFTFIYILMPNTRVKLKAGLIAGIVAGTIFQIVQWGYISFQIGAARYNAIYGSFAALPLFLMWVQISWWVVLFGAELSFANQNVHTYEYEPDCLKISPAFKKLLALQITHLLIQNFAKGQKPLNDTQISRRLKIPIRLVHNILFGLVESGLLSETRTAEDKEFGYQPARDINALSVHSILETLEQHGTNNIPVARTEELTVLSDTMQKFSKALESSPANKLLKDI